MPLIKVDDQNGSVQYSGSDWFPDGTGTGEEFMGTATATFVQGATAKLQFQGNSIQVFGTIVGESASSYSVDGSDPFTFHIGQSAVENSPQFRQMFYQSPSLSNGEHTLTVTNIDNQPLILDFFLVQDPDGLPTRPSEPSLDPPTPSAPPTPTEPSPNSPGKDQNTITPPSTVFRSTSFSSTTPESVLTTTARSVSLNATVFKPPVLGSTTAESSSLPFESLTSGSVVPVTSTPAPSALGSSPGSERHPSRPKGAIAGIIVGIAVTFALLAIFFLRRRRRERLSPPIPYPMSSAPDSHERGDGNTILDIRRNSAAFESKAVHRPPEERGGSDSASSLPIYQSETRSSVAELLSGAFLRRDRSQGSRGRSGLSHEDLPPYPGTGNPTPRELKRRRARSSTY